MSEHVPHLPKRAVPPGAGVVEDSAPRHPSQRARWWFSGRSLGRSALCGRSDGEQGGDEAGRSLDLP